MLKIKAIHPHPQFDMFTMSYDAAILEANFRCLVEDANERKFAAVDAHQVHGPRAADLPALR